MAELEQAFAGYIRPWLWNSRRPRGLWVEKRAPLRPNKCCRTCHRVYAEWGVSKRCPDCRAAGKQVT